MSYNISAWHQETCSLLLPVELASQYEIVGAEPGEMFQPAGIELDAEVGEVLGVMRPFGFSIERIGLYGEGSGRAYNDLRKMLGDTQGFMRALVVWECGDDVVWLTVDNGMVKEDSIIPRLGR